MSFILDALKKSETERQQQGNVELAGMPHSSSSKRGRTWIAIIGALLVINLAVLFGLLLRSDNTPESRAADHLPPEMTTPSAEHTDTETPSFADQVANARQNAPPKQVEKASTEMTTPAVSQPTVKPIIVSQDPEAIRSSDIYPTIHAVRANGAISIPDLHLDIHVYSDVPKDRFVFINMSKHREGSQLKEGPVVDKITPDGVVLGHRGISFLLPRD